VKIDTDEVIDAGELEGAKVHGTVTGLANQIAIDGLDFHYSRIILWCL